MIERLNQLSLNEFIELSCGNLSVLKADEIVDESILKELASKLIYEYKNITDSTGMKAVLIEREDLVKARTHIVLLRICHTLLSIKGYDECRDILSLMDIDMYNMGDERVEQKVEELLHTALFEQKRSDDMRSHEGERKATTSEQIRAAFDSEIAFLMTYFKMNIDIRIINAAVYANIVHQAIIDINTKRMIK